ncbi:MAG: hypothetical protein H0W48_14010, partial [Methylibium sp.]|nr:hypothetical protein [Methylibium sp.]
MRKGFGSVGHTTFKPRVQQFTDGLLRERSALSGRKARRLPHLMARRKCTARRIQADPFSSLPDTLMTSRTLLSLTLLFSLTAFSATAREVNSCRIEPGALCGGHELSGAK